MVRDYRQDQAIGGFALALFVIAIIYNLTEAAFKVMHPVWIAFLLATSSMWPPAPCERVSVAASE